jgi:hypothetical protein
MENPRRKIFIAAIVMLIVAGAWFAKPAYRAVRGWRADSLAADAEAAVGRQAWPEAWQKAQAAYHLNPNSPRAMRVTARLYTMAGQPNALTFWENLRASGKATMEDRRELIRAGVRFGKTAQVRPEVFKLTSEKPVVAENLRVAIEFCLVTGEKTNAVFFSRQLAKIEPGPTADLALAQTLLETREPADQEEARGLLLKVSALKNALGLEALVMLSNAGLLPDSSAPDLLDRLAKFPAKDVSQRLLADELRLRIKSQDRPAVVAALVNEFANAALTNRLAVARWMNLHHEFARSLELLPRKDASTNRDAFLTRIDALPPLGKWKEARAELESENVPIEPVLRELYLARTARELGMLPEAEAHWRRVHLELATKPEAMLYVAEYAEKLGELDEARKAYGRLAAIPEHADKAYAGLIRIAERTGGTRTLREIMRDLSGRRPDDPAPKNDFAYLNLLLNERVEQSKDAAEKLVEAQPNVMAFRTTLALAYLRLDDPSSALKLYDGLKLDWKTLRPGWQAVHAAVVGAAGDKQQAQALARQVPQNGLKPEERALIQPWL